MDRCVTCNNGRRLPAKLREVERGPRGEPQYVCADCGRGKAEPCPMCGGDEANCNFNDCTDDCSEMHRADRP